MYESYKRNLSLMTVIAVIDVNVSIENEFSKELLSRENDISK